jgi:hypothetical protein
MVRALTEFVILEQLQSGLPIMWGSAAEAQFQSTPGVSALAAPRTNKCLFDRNATAQRSGSAKRRNCR